MSINQNDPLLKKLAGHQVIRREIGIEIVRDCYDALSEMYATKRPIENQFYEEIKDKVLVYIKQWTAIKFPNKKSAVLSVSSIENGATSITQTILSGNIKTPTGIYLTLAEETQKLIDTKLNKPANGR